MCPTVATRQVTGLASLFDCLRHVSAEVTLHFSTKELRISQLAGTNTLFIFAELLADRFERFEVSAPASIVVSTGTLHTVLSTITRRVRRDANCVLELSFDKDRSFCLHLTGGTNLEYELPCKRVTKSKEDIELEQRVAPLFVENSGYRYKMYMSQRHLSHLASHVFPLGEYISLSCDSKAVRFCVTSPHSMITSARIAFRLTSDTSSSSSRPSKRSKHHHDTTTTKGNDGGKGGVNENEERGQGGEGDDDDAAEEKQPSFVFKQPLICMLVRAMSLYSTAAVMLPDAADENKPVIMSANVGDLGKLSVAIAQVTAED